jgi:hypothetical protein
MTSQDKTCLKAPEQSIRDDLDGRPRILLSTRSKIDTLDGG